MNLISIVIPVYNRENYISECRITINNYKYEDLEPILINMK